MKELNRRVLFIGLAIAASSHDGARGADALDPCTLLTPVQVSAALAVQVGAGKRLASAAYQWSDNAQSKKVDLTLLTDRGFAAAKAQIGGPVTKTPVSGIGDEAIFGVTGKVATTLAVRKGGTMFVVNVRGFPLDQPQAIEAVQSKERALALQILSKL